MLNIKQNMHNMQMNMQKICNQRPAGTDNLAPVIQRPAGTGNLAPNNQLAGTVSHGLGGLLPADTRHLPLAA